jgi:hypothetical protein
VARVTKDTTWLRLAIVIAAIVIGIWLLGMFGW